MQRIFRPRCLSQLSRILMTKHLNLQLSSGNSFPQQRRLLCSGSDTLGTSVPGVVTEGDKYIIAFTCKVCEKRSAKKISKQAYHQGCVVVRCPQCENLHLIADNLGVFEEKGWSIQKYLGDANFSALSVDDILELTKKTLSKSGPGPSPNESCSS